MLDETEEEMESLRKQEELAKKDEIFLRSSKWIREI
jgi:hypothetical protein